MKNRYFLNYFHDKQIVGLQQISKKSNFISELILIGKGSKRWIYHLSTIFFRWGFPLMGSQRIPPIGNLPPNGLSATPAYGLLAPLSPLLGGQHCPPSRMCPLSEFDENFLFFILNGKKASLLSSLRNIFSGTPCRKEY